MESGTRCDWLGQNTYGNGEDIDLKGFMSHNANLKHSICVTKNNQTDQTILHFSKVLIIFKSYFIFFFDISESIKDDFSNFHFIYMLNKIKCL